GPLDSMARSFDVGAPTPGRTGPEPPGGGATLYGEGPDGRRAIRLQYESEGARRVVGFNLMGVRYRHAVCADWIARGAGVEEVLCRLGAANFDPEFFDACEGALVDAYNARHGTALRLRARRGWRRWMARLPMNGTTPHRLADSFAHLP